MRRGKIYLNDIYAGLLTEDENGFTFAYDAGFLRSGKAEAVSLTLPLTDKPYHDTVLFPFFDGLIPEGWLLNIAEKQLEDKSARPYVAVAGLLQGLHRGSKCSRG